MGLRVRVGAFRLGLRLGSGARARVRAMAKVRVAAKEEDRRDHLCLASATKPTYPNPTLKLP